MEVTITQESPITVKADVVVPWAQVEGHYKSCLKSIAKNVQVPGFRKGKAPAAVLKKRYHDHILSEVAQKVVPETMEKWIEEKEVKAVGTPRLAHLDMKTGENFAYIAEIDVMPEVTLKDWKGIEAEGLNVTVTDEQVEEEVQRRLAAANHKHTITDRPAKEGDTVAIALTALDAESGDAITDLEDYRINLDGEGHAFLAEAVTGMSTGEDKEVSYDAPEDEAFEDWRGKTVKLMIEVSEITHYHTVELNDAFAEKQGAKDLASLNDFIKEEMIKIANQEEEGRLQNDVLQRLAADYDFELPRDLVLNEARSMVEQQMMPYMQMLQGQDQAMQRRLVDQMMEMSVPQAAEKARLDLVLGELAKAENITASEEEMTAELEKVVEYSKSGSVEELRKQMEDNGTLDNLEAYVKRQKAVKAVVDAAKVTMVDKLSTDEAEENEEAAEETEVLETEVVSANSEDNA